MVLTEWFEAKVTLIQAARSFYEKNWMLGTSGNLSLRLSGPDEPLEYLITASGQEKGALTLNDFVRVDHTGNPAKGEDPAKKGSAETLLHGAVYQHFSAAMAVYHVHTVAAGILSRHSTRPDNTLSFSDLEMLKGLGFSTHESTAILPVLENSQDMTVLVQQLPAVLRPEVPGFILKDHGLYTWGRSPAEAKRHVEIWEYLFQYRLTEMMLSRK